MPNKVSASSRRGGISLDIPFSRTSPERRIAIHLDLDDTALGGHNIQATESIKLSLDIFMGIPLRNMGPSEVFDDAVKRSLAAGAAGFLVFGCLQTSGPFLTIHRESLFVASGMLAAFLTT